MSADRGKPVHLTNGERRLLIDIIKAEIARLEGGLEPSSTRLDSDEGQVQKFRKLRLRQYRRLVNELTFPESTEGQYTVEPAKATCPWKQSDTTPCVRTDGPSAYGDDHRCKGCGRLPCLTRVALGEPEQPAGGVPR